jgi:GNAT superfamily N-acetyltransferase
VSEIVTCLEMTSPTQLVPGRPPPDPLEVAEVGPDSAALVRTIYVRIWAPLASGGRMAWSDEQWADELSGPGVHTWVARVNGTVAGFVELGADVSGDVGIVVFGLVPEFQAKGFGGAFLALATETAWRIGSSAGGPTERVWLQTSSGDHTHALPNYKRRGFRVFESRAGH